MNLKSIPEMNKEDDEFSWRQQFNQLRQKNLLIDFRVNVKDKEYPVHKLILAIESDFFLAMFSHNSKEMIDGKVILKDADPTVIEKIIEFCYTGQIQLNDENVEQMLTTASMLQIAKVQDTCVSFVEERLDYSNCLGILNLSERVNLPTLKTKVFDYCVKHFQWVVDEKEFLDLEVNFLLAIISSDELNVENELDVVTAIHRWIGADPSRIPHLDSLINAIRLVHLDKFDLANLDTQKPFSESTVCKDLISQAKSYIILKDQPEKRKPFEAKLETKARSSRRRQRLYVVGGWTDKSRSNKTAEVYDPCKDCWSSLPPMNQKRCGVGLVTYFNSLFAVGGHDGEGYLRSVERYDIDRGEWFADVASMKHVRTSVGVTSLGNFIYAIGGQINNDATDKVEKYSFDRDTWEDCNPMAKRRLGAGVAVCGDYIYVMGGYDGSKVYKTVERYNPKTNSWSFVASMKTARKHLGSCTCHGKIYAVGGRNKHGELDAGEVYDPNTDTWESIEPMTIARCGIGLVELYNQIYAIGGSNQDIRLNLVEAYNPKTNKWNTKAPMLACRLGGGMTAHPVTR